MTTPKNQRDTTLEAFLPICGASIFLCHFPNNSSAAFFGATDTGLRGKVEDYKAYILSLLFFKPLSDDYEWETEKRTEQFRRPYGKEPNVKQLARLQEEGHAFTIPPNCFWADVRSAALDDKNERLHEAVNGIAERNPALRGIINSVRWNEPAPDGTGKKRLDPEVVAAPIHCLDPIPLDNSKVTPGVPGEAYEYLIKKFAGENKAGAGQSYTPPEVRDIQKNGWSSRNLRSISDIAMKCWSGRRCWKSSPTRRSIMASAASWRSASPGWTAKWSR